MPDEFCPTRKGDVMHDEYLDLQEAATFIRRSPQALYRMVGRRQVPYRKCGRRLLFKRSELVQYLEALPGVKIEEMRREVGSWGAAY